MSLFEFNQELYIKRREDAAAAKGRQKGRQEGRQEGTFLLQVRLVRKKMEKGLSVAEIADMLEEEEGRIQRIYDILSSNAKASDENCMKLIAVGEMSR